MLSAEEMPDDNAHLASVDIDFPRLGGDSLEGCPVPSGDLLSYLADEVPDGESLAAEDLTFLRTALVDQTRYWIWTFDEPDGLPLDGGFVPSQDGWVCRLRSPLDRHVVDAHISADPHEWGSSMLRKTRFTVAIAGA